MGVFLGLDTSNYTTSTALYDSDTGEVIMERKLLPTAPGALLVERSKGDFLNLMAGLREWVFPFFPVGQRVPTCPVSWWDRWRQRCFAVSLVCPAIPFPIRRAMWQRRFTVPVIWN